MEYCGEVISRTEARGRSQVYVSQGKYIIIRQIIISSSLSLKMLYFLVWIDAGLKDVYIIPLNARECIDATKKGNLARFINHSW